jgi:hypothetical protein
VQSPQDAPPVTVPQEPSDQVPPSSDSQVPPEAPPPEDVPWYDLPFEIPGLPGGADIPIPLAQRTNNPPQFGNVPPGGTLA